MTLTYWISHCENDSDAYSIRETTKKAVLAEIEKRGCFWNEAKEEFENDDRSQVFSVLNKVVVEYDNGLDLLKQCLGEGGIYENDEARLARSIKKSSEL